MTTEKKDYSYLKVKFIDISTNEIKFTHKGNEFLLISKNAGVYGGGTAVHLYLKKGFEKDFLKTIGWLVGDGGYKSQFKSDNYLKGIVDMRQIKQAAVEYINKMI